MWWMQSTGYCLSEEESDLLKTLRERKINQWNTPWHTHNHTDLVKHAQTCTCTYMYRDINDVELNYILPSFKQRRYSRICSLIIVGASR